MDTDINNYTYDEILTVLHATAEDVTNNTLHGKTYELVKKIKASENINEETKNEYIGFFWECFEYIVQQNKYEYTKPKLYPGSLPKAIPEVAVVNSNVNEFERGIVNPIKRETIKNTLIVSSKFSSTGSSSSDFSVILSEPLPNVTSLKVAGLELTNFYYNISKHLKNTHFSIHTYYFNTVTKEISNKNIKKIEFEDGYYDMSLFTTNLHAQLDADPKTNMIETTYNILKGKLNFILKESPPEQPPDNIEYRFDLDFSNLAPVKYYGIGWFMGFVKSYYSFQNDYRKEDQLNSDIGFNPERSLDFTGSKFFLLEVTDFNNNSPQVLLYNTKFNSSDLMAKIPNTSSLASIIYDDASDRIFKTRKYFGPVKLQKLRIRLLDEYGIVVLMNNADFSLTFEIESLDMPYKNTV